MLFNFFKSKVNRAAAPAAASQKSKSVKPVCFSSPEGKMGLRDKHGDTVIIPPVYDFIDKIVCDKRAIVYTCDGVSVISLEGEVIVPAGRYTTIKHYKNGMAAVEDEFGWTFIDVDGVEIHRRFKNVLWFFNEDVSGAQLRSGMWVYIDKAGKTISAKYNRIDEVHNGVAVVCLGGKSGVVKKEQTGMVEIMGCTCSRVALAENGFSAYVDGVWRNYDASGNVMDTGGEYARMDADIDIYRAYANSYAAM